MPGAIIQVDLLGRTAIAAGRAVNGCAPAGLSQPSLAHERQHRAMRRLIQSYLEHPADAMEEGVGAWFTSMRLRNQG